jgi:hypothetical protein
MCCLIWRIYEMHPALSLKSGCDTGDINRGVDGCRGSGTGWASPGPLGLRVGWLRRKPRATATLMVERMKSAMVHWIEINCVD